MGLYEHLRQQRSREAMVSTGAMGDAHHFSQQGVEEGAPLAAGLTADEISRLLVERERNGFARGRNVGYQDGRRVALRGAELDERQHVAYVLDTLSTELRQSLANRATANLGVANGLVELIDRPLSREDSVKGKRQRAQRAHHAEKVREDASDMLERVKKQLAAIEELRVQVLAKGLPL